MCTFIFCYTDGSKCNFQHIKKAMYIKSEIVTVDEQNLLTHRFPMNCDLHLFCDNSNFTVSGHNLLYIEINKES